MTGRLLTTRQVAARLGVTHQTIYAYVSRGILSRTLAEDGRTSRFEAAEVEQLARRGRPRKGSERVGSVDVSLSSAVTQIDGSHIRYRGQDAAALAREASFEQVARLLWTGELPKRTCFALPTPVPRVALSTARLLPRTCPAIERFAAVTSALACERPLRIDLRPDAVSEHMASLIATLVEALPGPTPDKPRRGTAASATRQPIARRLWQRLSPLPPSESRVRVLNRALVLLADHELASSTLAARVAASTRADPYGVVLAGLAAASGALHGKAAAEVHRVLLSAHADHEPAEALVLRITEGGQKRTLAGFGHPVYTQGDPRARVLLDSLPELGRKRAGERAERVREAAEACVRKHANVDFALGALAYLSDMPVGATDAIFVLARIAGWTAHGLEEYGERPLRFRARAVFDG